MTIEIGMYVRTKDGDIRKLKIADKWTNDLLIIDYPKDQDFEVTLYLPSVVKYSFNIIDLIEVGDLINKVEVMQIFYDCEINECKNPYFNMADGTTIKKIKPTDEILTKEQYESNVYKAGGKNDN